MNRRRDPRCPRARGESHRDRGCSRLRWRSQEHAGRAVAAAIKRALRSDPSDRDRRCSASRCSRWRCSSSLARSPPPSRTKDERDRAGSAALAPTASAVVRLGRVHIRGLVPEVAHVRTTNAAPTPAPRRTSEAMQSPRHEAFLRAAVGLHATRSQDNWWFPTAEKVFERVQHAWITLLHVLAAIGRSRSQRSCFSGMRLRYGPLETRGCRRAGPGNNRRADRALVVCGREVLTLRTSSRAATTIGSRFPSS